MQYLLDQEEMDELNRVSLFHQDHQEMTMTPEQLLLGCQNAGITEISDYLRSDFAFFKTILKPEDLVAPGQWLNWKSEKTQLLSLDRLEKSTELALGKKSNKPKKSPIAWDPPDMWKETSPKPPVWSLCLKTFVLTIRMPEDGSWNNGDQAIWHFVTSRSVQKQKPIEEKDGGISVEVILTTVIWQILDHLAGKIRALIRKEAEGRYQQSLRAAEEAKIQAIYDSMFIRYEEPKDQTA